MDKMHALEMRMALCMLHPVPPAVRRVGAVEQSVLRLSAIRLARTFIVSYVAVLCCLIAGSARIERMRAGAIHFSALALCILCESKRSI